MGCTPGSIIREAAYALLHPSVYPFYGLNLLYGMTQSIDLESQLGTASTVILKAAPVWYLVIYSKFIEPRRRRQSSRESRPSVVTYYPTCPCESPAAMPRNSDPPITASFRTERVMAVSRKANSGCSSPSCRNSTAANTPAAATSAIVRPTTSSIERDDNQKYKQYFMLGLVSSSIGDAFLVFPSTFLHGVFMFGVAHIFYILGLRKRFVNSDSNSKSTYAWLVIPVGMMMSPYLLTGIDNHTLGAAVVVYNLTINSMLYQAVSAVETDACNSSAFLAMIGALSFVLSDSMLALHAWKITLPYPTLLVMSTYYFAQVCFALSIY